MGVFHVFQIVQMVPNRATHHIVEDVLIVSDWIYYTILILIESI